MIRVWKFPLVIIDEQVILMPLGARLLCVANQADTICLWTAVDDQAGCAPRRILLHGTGHPVASPVRAAITYAQDLEVVAAAYVGSVQTHRGQFVWHIFDGGES